MYSTKGGNMRRIVTAILLSLTLVCLLAPVAFAAEGAAEGASDAKMGYYSWAAMACGLGMGLAALGTGIGQGIGLARASEGVARKAFHAA